MKIYKKVVIDIAANQIEEADSYEYDGPIAHCGNGGGNGGGNASPAGDPSDPSNEGGMGMASGMSAALGDAFDGDVSTDADTFAGQTDGKTDGDTGQNGVPIAALPNSAISNSLVGKALAATFATTPMGLALLGLNALGAFDGESTGDISGIGLGAGDNPDINKGSTQSAVSKPHENDATTKKVTPGAVEPPSFFETEQVAEKAGNITAANIRRRVGRLSMFYARPDRLSNPYIYIPSLTSVE